MPVSSSCSSLRMIRSSCRSLTTMPLHGRALATARGTASWFAIVDKMGICHLPSPGGQVWKREERPVAAIQLVTFHGS
jgi:hypothetical protein